MLNDNRHLLLLDKTHMSDLTSSFRHTCSSAHSMLFTGQKIEADTACIPSDEWAEEMEALQAIYGPDVTVIDNRRLQIRLDDGRAVLDLRLSLPGQYPAKPPCIAIK